MKKTLIFVFAALILIISFVSFLPSLKNGFIYGDDNNYVVKSHLISDLSWHGIRNIFTYMHMGLYKPLTILSFALEYHFFKLDPYIYHLTNLILHLINSLLVFWLILLISRKPWVAFITALLFGIHPIHVESVAWVSERKDVLYSVFFLSGIITYIYWLRGKKIIYRHMTFILFIFTFLVKPMGLTFPLILLLCDYIFNLKLNYDNIKRKMIFFVSSGILLAFTLIFAREYSSLKPSFNFLDSILIANYALLFYLSKIMLPVNLSPLYPYPQKIGYFLPLIFLISPVIIFFMTRVVILSGRYTRKVIFGTLFFLVCLIPVLQLMPTGNAIVADRYAYLSSIGILYIVAELILSRPFMTKIYNGRFLMKALAFAVFAVMIATLSFMTWNRTKVWMNPDTWFNDVLKLHPPEIKKEIVFNKKEIALNHEPAQAYNNLAVIYGNLGSSETAVYLCQKAVELNPNSAQIYNNLAAASGFSKDFDKSIEFAKKSIELDPRFASAYNNLAVAYYYEKQYQLAIKNIDIAISLGFKADPYFLSVIKKYRQDRH